jgi:hypothetical protein
MTQQHPITPPPELVEQWGHLPADWNTVAPLIAQWGADQELEACCEWVKSKQTYWAHDELRAARRPKPPSLKEQALDALAHIATGPNPTAFLDCQDTIRRALEQLDN